MSRQAGSNHRGGAQAQSRHQWQVQLQVRRRGDSDEKRHGRCPPPAASARLLRRGRSRSRPVQMTQTAATARRTLCERLVATVCSSRSAAKPATSASFITAPAFWLAIAWAGKLSSRRFVIEQSMRPLHTPSLSIHSRRARRRQPKRMAHWEAKVRRTSQQAAVRTHKRRPKALRCCDLPGRRRGTSESSASVEASTRHDARCTGRRRAANILDATTLPCRRL